MAPIPDENEKKKAPQEGEEEELSNPNLVVNLAASDSSGDEGGNEDLVSTGGYTLLAQEPGEASDSDSESSEDEDVAEELGLESGDQNPGVLTESSPVAGAGLPQVVLASEAGAAAPTGSVSQSAMHPAFLAQFPDGKVPSYMQVPEMPSVKSQQLLWNQKTADCNKLSLAPEEKKNILQAMSGFHLPQENVPDWARNMSESQWQHLLLQRIKTTPGHSHSQQAPAQQEGEGSNTSQAHSDAAACQEPWVAEFPES